MAIYPARGKACGNLFEVVMFRKLAAECFGTFWLVFGGCGSAVLAAAFPELGIGFVGVALAFGLTVLTMAFAVGHISGGHFNPAVTLGLWAGGRFPAKDVIGYIVAQVVAVLLRRAFCTSLPAVKPALTRRPAALPLTASANTLRAVTPCCLPS
jgi:aquaporin Z